MNVLITGATGFIGTHLTKNLLSQGHRCRCLVRDRKKAEERLGISANTEIFSADLTDQDSLKGITDGVDLVYHLAVAGTLTVHRKNYEEEIYATNVRGTKNLLQECLVKPVRKLIHFSSSSVMGLINRANADETTVCHPLNAYQRSKLEGEQLVLDTWRNHRLPAVILRPCPVYGHGGKGRLYDITRLVKKGIFPRLGKKKATLSLVHVNDVVRAAVLAGLKAPPGEVYFIASEQAYELDYLRKLILDYLGLKRPYLFVPVSLAKGVAFLTEKFADLAGSTPVLRVKDIDAALDKGSLSIEKAKRHLGFHPEIPLESGLRETLEWYKESGFL